MVYLVFFLISKNIAFQILPIDGGETVPICGPGCVSKRHSIFWAHVSVIDCLLEFTLVNYLILIYFNVISLFFRPYSSSNFVTLAQSNSTLQFPSGLKVVRKNGKEELLVTSSKFHSYFLGSLNPADDNYHILSASVSDLVRDTLCDPSSHHKIPKILFP